MIEDQFGATNGSNETTRKTLRPDTAQERELKKWRSFEGRLKHAQEQTQITQLIIIIIKNYIKLKLN